MTDIKKAYDKLTSKLKPYKTLTDYYEGNQPLKYSAERLRDAFDSSLTKFIINWCSVVIDCVLDRLIFKGWDAESETDDDILDDFYIDNDLQILGHKVHKNALVTSESFIIFDQGEDKELKAFYNDSRNVQLFYDDNGNKLFGAKWWVDEKEKKRLNLYYPDRIEKYLADKSISSEKSFALDITDKNPYAPLIPIVHFQTGYSELQNIITLQDAINKLFSDMMVVGEFNAFKQRWMVTNADISTLKNSPKSILQLPKGTSDEEGTQIGEFTAADLKGYLDAMDKLANSIAIISRTPKHYFMDTGSAISGEALIVMESPLVKKIQQIQANYSEAWIEVADFIRPNADVSLLWEPLETVQPLMQAEQMLVLKNLGIPLMTILRRAGWGADEIKQFEDDALAERSSKATETALLLEEIRKRDAQNNQVV
jgi:hypothetical protein